MGRRTVPQLAFAALAISGLTFVIGAPGVAAPPCNPNANGVAQSGQPDKGNDDHPPCPAAAPDPGVAPSPEVSPTGTSSTPAPAAAAARAVTGQPRLTG